MAHYPNPYFKRTQGLSRMGRALRLITGTGRPFPKVEGHVASVLSASPEAITARFSRIMVSNYPGPRA